MIAGHKKQWQFLLKSKELNKIPHAFLFSGESQIGKRKVAFEFAKLFFCERNRKPCQECRSCREIERNSHPDFIFLSSSSGNNIQVSQIRDLVWKLSLKPYSSGCKVAVIDQAHLMDKEAQNCLLKTLEEPRGKSFLILITEYPETLFSTIASRAQKVKFFPVKEEDIQKYLAEKGIKKPDCFFLGKPGRVIDFVSNEEKIREQKKIISDLENISSWDLSVRFNYIKKMTSEENKIFSFKEIMDIWLNYFRSLMISKLEKSETDSVARIKETISFIQRVKHLMDTTNVNPKLALEILLMNV